MHVTFARTRVREDMITKGDVGGVRWQSSPGRIMTSSDSDGAGCEQAVLRVDDHVCTVSLATKLESHTKAGTDCVRHSAGNH